MKSWFGCILLAMGLAWAPRVKAQQSAPEPSTPVVPAAAPGTHAPAPADAYPPPVPLATHFADVGHFFVEGVSDIAFNLTWADNASTRYMINIAPGVGYFFTPWLFGRLGIDFAYEHPPATIQSDGAASGALNVALVPGVGGAFPLSHWVTMAPWLGVGIGQAFFFETPSDVHRSKIDIQLHLPFVLDMIEHFSLSAGPYYKQQVFNQIASGGQSADVPKEGDFGVAVGFIGYW